MYQLPFVGTCEQNTFVRKTFVLHLEMARFGTWTLLWLVCMLVEKRAIQPVKAAPEQPPMTCSLKIATKYHSIQALKITDTHQTPMEIVYV